jgi:hypothetical protein
VNLQTTVLIWLFCAAIGAALAHSKNRPWTEGLLLGGLLGVIGVIIELFLKAQPKQPNPGMPAPAAMPLPGWYPDPAGAGGHRYWDGRMWCDQPPAIGDQPS